MKRELLTEKTTTTPYYRHFKGGWYTVLDTATDTVTDGTVVIYMSLKTGKKFTRPIDEFLGPTDKVKYPDAQQDLRLASISELVDQFGLDAVREMFMKENEWL